MSNLPLHIKAFNDKIKTMNQTNSKALILSAEEARNLHAEVFALLAEILRLGKNAPEEPKSVEMDGGDF